MPRRLVVVTAFSDPSSPVTLAAPETPPPPAPVQVLATTATVTEARGGGNMNTSLIVVGGIVILVFVISTSLHLLLRYLNRRCALGDEDGDDDVAPIEPVHVHRVSGRRVVPEDHQTLIDSLPLFSFDSVSGLRSSADCAVCLSKFEPHDQLRLLPLCCHAFHARCIDTWLESSHTCPLCRSTIHVDESDDGYLKLFSSSSGGRGGDSFRIEIGSVSRRRITSGPDSDGPRRSYSMGSFDYMVDDESEIIVEPTHRRGGSECSVGGKKDEMSAAVREGPAANAPGAEVAAEVAAGRGWLRDYVDRIAPSSSSSFSSRNLSFRLSGRFFSGSSRRTEGLSAGAGSVGGGSSDLDRNGFSEEIGNFFRWLSGV